LFAALTAAQSAKEETVREIVGRGRVYQLERNLRIKANAESLVAELRRPPDDHGSAQIHPRAERREITNRAIIRR
jgi:hypothetical protein